MTEYWKSQGKKFCEYCKCWISDNKASIGFHEGGKKHQLNVQNRLQQIRRNAAEDNRQSKREASWIREMEANALNTYRTSDLQSNADLTARIFNQKKAERDENRKAAEDASSAAMVAALAAQEEEQLLAGVGTSSGSKVIGPQIGAGQVGGSYLRRVEAPKSGTKWHKGSGPKVWFEALMEDGSGAKYYWHVETKESRWDPPPEGYLSIEEQVQINKKQEARDMIKNATIAASQAVHGKGHITAIPKEYGSTPSSSSSSLAPGVSPDYGPITKCDPYGGWQTVSKEPKTEPTYIDWGCPEIKDPIQSKAKLHSEKDRYAFKEKTVSSIQEKTADLSESSNPVKKPVINFRKRKIDAEGKKKSIRKREEEDDY